MRLIGLQLRSTPLPETRKSDPGSSLGLFSRGLREINTNALSLSWVVGPGQPGRMLEHFGANICRRWLVLALGVPCR